MLPKLFGARFGGAAQNNIVEQVPVASADEVQQLTRELDTLRSAVRRSGSVLPGLLSSQLRQIDDLLRPLLDYVRSNGSSTEQMVLLGAIINSYIPTPLQAYMVAEASEHSDDSETTKLFAEQLKVLEATARDLDRQVRSGAIWELSVHARFLQDKFGPSLELEGNR